MQATSRGAWLGSIVGALVGVTTAVVLTACSGGTTTTTTGTPETPPAPSSTPNPAPPATTFGDGTYAVGPDIVAGTYHSDGAVPGGTLGCYWERDKDTTGNAGSILANNLGKGPVTVTIEPGDGAFKASGCQPWNLVHGK